MNLKSILRRTVTFAIPSPKQVIPSLLREAPEMSAQTPAEGYDEPEKKPAARTA